MQCPICHQEMTVWKEEQSHNSKTGTIYRRTRYVCQTDDVWGRLEVPQGKAEKELAVSSAIS